MLSNGAIAPRVLDPEESAASAGGNRFPSGTKAMGVIPAAHSCEPGPYPTGQRPPRGGVGVQIGVW
jgi:hypothetical protein